MTFFEPPILSGAGGEIEANDFLTWGLHLPER